MMLSWMIGGLFLTIEVIGVILISSYRGFE